MKTLTELQQAIENLETRNAFQDDVIEQLNHELSVHQEKIVELTQQVSLLAKRIKNNNNDAEPNMLDVEPPPPHY